MLRAAAAAFKNSGPFLAWRTAWVATPWPRATSVGRHLPGKTPEGLQSAVLIGRAELSGLRHLPPQTGDLPLVQEDPEPPRSRHLRHRQAHRQAAQVNCSNDSHDGFWGRAREQWLPALPQTPSQPYKGLGVGARGR